MTKVSPALLSFGSHNQPKCIDTSPVGDANSLEDSHPTHRDRNYLVEHDKRDCVALSPGDVGLTVNTTPNNVLGGFDSYRPL